MLEKTDKRYIKTHCQIRNIFKELIFEMEYRDITVSEIARRADINRKTFYRHYQSQYSILEELQQEIMEDLSGLQDFSCLPLELEHYSRFVKGFLRIILKNKALHRRLFCSGEYRFVFDSIRINSKKKIVDSLGNAEGKGFEHQQLFIDFNSYGFLFVIGDWLASESSMPEDQFADFLAGTMYHSMKSYLNLDAV